MLPKTSRDTSISSKVVGNRAVKAAALTILRREHADATGIA